MEILAGELPIKVLYRVDDLLAAPDDASAPTSPGLRCRQIAHMAMGLNQVYVLHAAASHLPRCGERIASAMRFAGRRSSASIPARAALPPDSRRTWRRRRRWSRARFRRSSTTCRAAPTGRHASASTTTRSQISTGQSTASSTRTRAINARASTWRFTFVDFVAGDARFAPHFARLTSGFDESDLAPIDEMLLREAGRLPERIPRLRMIDERDRRKPSSSTSRCAGAARARCAQPPGLSVPQRRQSPARTRARCSGGCARERPRGRPLLRRMEGRRDVAARRRRAAAGPGRSARARRGLHRDGALLDVQRAHAINRRCSPTSQQAGLHCRPEGGTYAQLVEAAESCQVSVIHPASRATRTSPGSPSCWCAPSRSAERGRRQAVT